MSEVSPISAVLDDGVNVRGNPGIVGRHDLDAAGLGGHGPPAQVNLVAVVRGRVVAGRDHHPGLALQRPHGIGQHGGWQGRGQQEGLDAGGSKDGRRLLGKDCQSCAGRQIPQPPWAGRRALAPEEAPASSGRVSGCGGGSERVRPGQGQQVGGHPGSGPAHHNPVHPVRARAHGGPQPGRAELQVAGEAVRQLQGLGSAIQLVQLGRGGRVGVMAGPLARRSLQGVLLECCFGRRRWLSFRCLTR